MSRYTTYYKSKQLEYRTLAINWSIFADSHKIPGYQRRGMALFFKPIARRFGLIEEFKKLNLI